MSVELILLSAEDVREAVDMDAAIDAVADAYRELSGGRAQSPIRLGLEAPRGVSLFMPAFLEGSGALGAKVVSVFRKNPDRGLPVINGIVLLLDPETGVPRAIMDGTYLTALRTGAGSGAATRALAREDASVLAIFGAGAQARTQVAAVRAVRAIREVRIVSLSSATSRAFADELEGVEVRIFDDPAAAVEGAHVICAATTSTEPVFPGAAVAPGTHVNGVGSFKPEMQEVDGALLLKARVVVDARDAALEEAGDLVVPIREGLFGEDHIAAEIGEILDGRAPGRRDPEEITYFKSVGNAVQDVAVGLLAVREAEARGLGTRVRL